MSRREVPGRWCHWAGAGGGGRTQGGFGELDGRRAFAGARRGRRESRCWQGSVRRRGQLELGDGEGYVRSTLSMGGKITCAAGVFPARSGWRGVRQKHWWACPKRLNFKKFYSDNKLTQ